MHEFNLIQKYFTWNKPPSGVGVAVGDDAAVLNLSSNKQLVTSIDTFISGVHFPINTPPHAIEHKSLAVNLSDIAAMGATPKWFTLALTLPEIDSHWLQAFSKGLKQLAENYDCFLVGGDTTRGPLSISIQVMGDVDKGQSLLRSGAKIGDKIYVTGTLGDAAVGLQLIEYENNEFDQLSNQLFCEQRLNYPTPRVNEGVLIKHFASSCIDVSDGLLQDLSHILESSNVGATIDTSSLPLSNSLKSIEKEKAINYALTGGDDYELLFTVDPANESQFLMAINSDESYRCIGFITSNSGEVVDENDLLLKSVGYNHFD